MFVGCGTHIGLAFLVVPSLFNICRHRRMGEMRADTMNGYDYLFRMKEDIVSWLNDLSLFMGSIKMLKWALLFSPPPPPASYKMVMCGPGLAPYIHTISVNHNLTAAQPHRMQGQRDQSRAECLAFIIDLGTKIKDVCFVQPTRFSINIFPNVLSSLCHTQRWALALTQFAIGCGMPACKCWVYFYA